MSYGTLFDAIKRAAAIWNLDIRRAGVDLALLQSVDDFDTEGERLLNGLKGVWSTIKRSSFKTNNGSNGSNGPSGDHEPTDNTRDDISAKAKAKASAKASAKANLPLSRSASQVSQILLVRVQCESMSTV